MNQKKENVTKKKFFNTRFTVFCSFKTLKYLPVIVIKKNSISKKMKLNKKFLVILLITLITTLFRIIFKSIYYKL